MESAAACPEVGELFLDLLVEAFELTTERSTADVHFGRDGEARDPQIVVESQLRVLCIPPRQKEEGIHATRFSDEGLGVVHGPDRVDEVIHVLVFRALVAHDAIHVLHEIPERQPRFENSDHAQPWVLLNQSGGWKMDEWRFRITCLPKSNDLAPAGLDVRPIQHVHPLADPHFVERSRILVWRGIEIEIGFARPRANEGQLSRGVRALRFRCLPRARCRRVALNTRSAARYRRVRHRRSHDVVGGASDLELLRVTRGATGELVARKQLRRAGLLHDMCQLMRQQAPAVVSLGGVAARSEHDIAPDCESLRIHGSR